MYRLHLHEFHFCLETGLLTYHQMIFFNRNHAKSVQEAIVVHAVLCFSHGFDEYDINYRLRQICIHKFWAVPAQLAKLCTIYISNMKLLHYYTIFMYQVFWKFV